MLEDSPHLIRNAQAKDESQILSLWELMYVEMDAVSSEDWKREATAWFAKNVESHDNIRLPVIEVSGQIVASAVGILEIGVPNPHCPTGRAVRLMNVFTLPTYRGHGFATALINSVIEWSKAINADRIDLSATPMGQRVYENLGFSIATAPRMKRML